MLKAIDGPDFLERLAEVGMTQRQFAAFIGVHENSVSNWVRGEQEIPGPVRRCLMFMRILHLTYEKALEVEI